MKFVEDHALNLRLGDMEFHGLSSDRTTRDLRFELSEEPIEIGRVLWFRKARAFDVARFHVQNFHVQNVVSHLEHALLEEERLPDFAAMAMAMATAELGRDSFAVQGHGRGRWLGAIRLPSNGAIASAIRAAVELCDAAGSVLRRIDARSGPWPAPAEDQG